MFDAVELHDGSKRLHLSMEEKKCVGSFEDENGNIVAEYDDNLIEICFSETDDEGWGCGGGEYISTNDIKAMADSVRDVTLMKKRDAQHNCLDDIIRFRLTYDPQSKRFSFTLEMLEFLCRDYYISITKSSLSREELDQLVEPVFLWEKQYPIVP